MENITNPRNLLIKKELPNCTCKLKLMWRKKCVENIWRSTGKRKLKILFHEEKVFPRNFMCITLCSTKFIT